MAPSIQTDAGKEGREGGEGGENAFEMNPQSALIFLQKKNSQVKIS